MSIRVYSREMPLDDFLGLIGLNELRQHLSADLTLQFPDRVWPILQEWRQVEAMQMELDRSQRRQDGRQTGEWVICLPMRDNSYSQVAAVVRKYENNGNTYVATPHHELGTLIASEMLEPGGSPYDVEG